MHKIEDAIDIANQAGENELFIIGGEEIYKLAMPYTMRIYLTRIHGEFEGDTYYPILNTTIWKEISRIKHKMDKHNPYDYDYLIYERK